MSELKEMMHIQNALQKFFGYDFEKMTTEERVKYIKEYYIHSTAELNELLYELPFFKPWKDYSDMSATEIASAMDKAKNEFVDVWHFILNIALALGITGDELFTEYLAKNEENYRRNIEGRNKGIRYKGDE